jgi:hypothetical protein
MDDSLTLSRMVVGFGSEDVKQEEEDSSFTGQFFRAHHS